MKSFNDYAILEIYFFVLLVEYWAENKWQSGGNPIAELESKKRLNVFYRIASKISIDM